jgi:hypothetical protein
MNDILFDSFNEFLLFDVEVIYLLVGKIPCESADHTGENKGIGVSSSQTMFEQVHRSK